MLTFLRKIRKSLIESGSTRKYIAYAVGEILLVMIGILLALQVNNWNESRKARRAEVVSLINLKEEFQKNQRDLKEHIQWKQRVRGQWDTFFIMLSNKQFLEEQKAMRRPIASYVNYIISNSILNSLLASGKIDNLQNDSLRYLLTTWEDIVKDYQQFQEMHRDFVNYELMPFENTLFQNHSNQRYGYDYQLSAKVNQEAMYLEAYDDMAYQNILLRNFYWINIQLSRIKGLEEKMNQIIHLLDKEISPNNG